MKAIQENLRINTDWLLGDHVFVDDLELPVKQLFMEERKEELLYYSEYFLIGTNILVAVSTGVPSLEDISAEIKKLRKYLESIGQKKYYFIWDISKIKTLNAKIRKRIIDEKTKLDPFWHYQYLVVGGTLKMLFKLYLIVHPEKVKNSGATASIVSALKLILNQKEYKRFSNKYVAPLNSSAQSLSNLSKDELISLVLDMEKRHNERTLQILNAVGKISWDAAFKPVSIRVQDNDPYFDLINVINLIQHDVYDIISELVDLNQNLELKVAERIVDIIDKESNLRSILDNADSETWLVNSRYELIDFNHLFYQSFVNRNAATPEINKNILDLMPDEEERDKWRLRYDAALRGRCGIYIDEVNDKGTLKIQEVKTSPIKEVGKIKGVSIFVKDITDLKKSELKLIQKNRDLEKVNSELDSFVYRVSHDLRAPLTSILGLINLLKIEKDSEKLAYYISLQEKSVKKLDDFIQDIINLSRNSRQEIAVEKIDFDALVKYIIEGQHFSQHADVIEKRVSIEIKSDFYTDKKRLGIVLNNLVSNGIKYCNARHEEPYIEIKVNADDEKAVIEVKDNGIGIADDHINKIFTMFYRANHDNSGSGLGLYIVKETVDKLYGSISVKSQLRQGSTFKVTLPNLKDFANSI